MASFDFFVRHGIFLSPSFLDEEDCVRIRAEMDAAAVEPATINRGGISQVVEAQRKTVLAGVGPGTATRVHALLDGLRPGLESHFGGPLAACEPPQFLIYREGDRFRPHRDTSGRPGTPGYINSRRVSAVVFLGNGSARDPGPRYEGGRLVLYNLPDEPTWDTARAELTGETGLLVAFPSGVFHEVTPVTRGQRHAIVTWFPAPDPRGCESNGPRA